jgi:hypothetical protein
MGSSIRTRVGALAAGLVAVLGGCQCGTPPVDCSDTTVTFEQPSPGTTVDSPFDVAVVVRDSTGAAFTFDSATLVVDGTSYTGTVLGNRATFGRVTAGGGARSLTATIASGTCQKVATTTVTVREVCSTPTVTAVTFPQDQAPLGVLTNADLPQGTNLQVRVAADCTEGVQVRILRGSTEVGPPTPFLNGVATVTLPTLPDSDSATYELFAELLKDGAAVNTPSGNPAALASIRVDRVAPACAVTTSGRFGPSADQAPNTPGFQMRVTGTTAPNSTAQFAITGQGAPVTAVPNATGEVSADFTLPATGTTTYTVTLTCRSAVGNTATATGMFVVDLEPPVVTITSPTSSDGGNPLVTRSPLAVQVSAAGAEDGSVVIVRRNGQPAGSGTVTGGVATVNVSFGADGTYTLEVQVTDAAGNVGAATLTVDVALDGCGALFSRPAQCPALLTAAQLAAGSTYSFQTTSKPACVGTSARLFRADVLADGGVGAETTVGTATLGATGLANFAPLALASGDYAFRAEVDDVGPDAGVSLADCRVTVDLDGPSITNPVVPSGFTFATINATQDTQPGTPGVQRQLAFSARVPMGGRVDVCTTQAVDPVTTQSRATSPECGAGWFVLAQNVTSPAAGFTFPEGSYSIKVVVVGGGLAMAPASAPVPLFVDGTRPCVNGLTRTLPQDTNGDGRLNIAELAGQAPRLEFELNAACGDSSPATLSTTTPVVVRDIVSGAPGPVRASTATFANGRYTVTLTGPYASEVNLDLFVELTDLANNRNLYTGTTDAARFAFRVDPVAPSCDLQRPSASQTLLGQADVPGGNFAVRVATALDVGTDGVRVTFGATPPRDVTPSNGLAETTYSVTGTNTYTVSAVCTDESGNATSSATRNITIDLDPPTCSITAPTAMTYSNSTIATSVTVGGAEGRQVAIRSTLGGSTPLATLTVSGGVAAGNVSYPNGTQTVTAEVSDAAGNTCTASVANVVVNSAACALAMTSGESLPNGLWFNRSNTGALTSSAPWTGTIAAVTANSADCRTGQTVTLVRTLPTAGSPVTATTAANGDVSFANVAVADGETWTVTIDNGSGLLTTRTFRVGLRIPVAGNVRINSFLVTTGEPLFFVAPTGNINLDPSAGTARATTYFADQAAGTAGAQVSVSLGAVSGTVYGDDDGRVEIRYGSTVLSTHLIEMEPYVLDPTQVTLPHNTTGQFVVRVVTAAGNSIDVVSNAGTVDVIAPAAPAVSQALTSARAATVTLEWDPVYDDGTDSASGGLLGGPVMQQAGYDVRWTTSSVPGNNAMATVADYFGSSSKQDGITAWSAGRITKALTLPPLNTYFIAVRARDEVGNYSAFAAPTGLDNLWTRTRLVAPVASSNFGASVVMAPLVGNDNANEVVVAASGRGGVGSVYVYSGAALLTTQMTCGAGCQELTPSDSVAGAFGADLSAAGNVGDVSGEGRRDLVVGQNWTASGNGGRAVIFFGTSAASLSVADSIELRGDSTNRIGLTTRIIRDIDGDGLDELALAAPLFNMNRGRVFIYRGRSRAAWAALRTATDPVTMIQYIPVSEATADHVIDGPSPLLAAAGNAFGQSRNGFVSVNDLDGDGRPDVGIPTSRASINRYRIFGSATLLASSGAMPLDSTSAFRLELSETPTSDNAITGGVGAAVVGGEDVIDSSAADLVVGYSGKPGAGEVMIYSALSAPTNPTINPPVAVRISGPLTFGATVAVGMLNADAQKEVVAATNATSANRVFVVYPQMGAFESGVLGSAPRFWVSTLDGQALTGNPSSRLGASLAIGDVDGDVAHDLVVGDSNTGEVRVWR